MYVACSCDCGRYTESYPKLVRLNHILAIGSAATVSCGWVGKKRFKENGEAVASKFSLAKIRAVFCAFVRKPWQVAKIAKRFGIMAALVGACYRLWMKRLVAMREGLVAGFEAISALEYRKFRRNGWKYDPNHDLNRSVIELNDEDITEPALRLAFGLVPA